MQDAVPPGEGAMAAVIGSTEEKVKEACKLAAQGEVISPANFNAPGQIVISGNRGAVQQASAALVESGAKVIPLAVSAPFHSPLMEPAATRLEKTLKEVELAEPKIPVVTNVEARPNNDMVRIRELLVRQVTAPVRWTESVKTMFEAGTKIFVEMGPGNVLSNLIRRIDSGATVQSVNSPAGLDKALATLEKL